MYAQLLSSMKSSLARLTADEEGGETIEWVLLVGLLIIACYIGVKALGINVANKWNDLIDVL